MSTHNIILCFYKEVDKSILVVIFRLLNCLTVRLHIGACAVIRSNTVLILFKLVGTSGAGDVSQPAQYINPLSIEVYSAFLKNSKF